MPVKDPAARAARINDVLGMPFGTAGARLRKALLFHLATRLELCSCFRCGKPIETVDEFSIEHKENWEFSDDPARLFFDLENIAFSHHRCNVGASRKPKHPSTKARDRAKYEAFRANTARYQGHLERKRKGGRKGENLHSHSTKAGDLQSPGITLSQPSDIGGSPART